MDAGAKHEGHAGGVDKPRLGVVQAKSENVGDGGGVDAQVEDAAVERDVAVQADVLLAGYCC